MRLRREVTSLLLWAAPITGGREDRQHDGRRLLGVVAERLPRYMAPTTIVARREIPLTVTGKRDRHAVLDIVAEQAPADPLTFLREAAKLLLGREIAATAPGLIELGVGSLSTARLIAELEKRYDVTLPLEDVVALGSLREVADLVCAGVRRRDVRA